MRKWMLFVVAALAVLAFAGYQFNDAGARGPGIDRAIEAQERHTPGLMNIRGVVGTGVGLDASGDAVIRIYVETPGLQNLPSVLDGVPAEVVVTGRIVAQCDKQSPCDRPVPIGISSGHPDITAGTLGARVTDGSSVFALSNNHVYAKSNDASLGDSALQPGPYDGGTDPTDKIGELYDFEPIDFGGGPNLMDAAIAITSTGEVGTSTPPDGYGTPSGNHIACETSCSNLLNLAVQKYGRTTGLTTGTISEVNVTVNVCYAGFAIFCTKSATFVEQIAIGSSSFSSGGDSGSLIVTQSGNDAVGLLFAGSSTRTIGNPIDVVLERFNVGIDAGGPAPTPTDTPTPAPATSTPTPTATQEPADTPTPTQEPADTPTPTATAAPSGIELDVFAYKFRGLQKADLTWSGASGGEVDIYRGTGTGTPTQVIETVPNVHPYQYTDNIDNRGGGTYTYRLCEAGTSNCSGNVTITY